MVSATLTIDRNREPLPVVQDPNGGTVPETFKGMRLRQMFVTPDKARELLAKHNNYRNLDQRKAEQYAEVMDRGEWGIFPPICIGQAGDLQDGQHRMVAVTLTGKGQWFTVVSGIPASAVDHYDNGRPRRPSDALRKKYGDDLRTSPRRLQSIIQLAHFGPAKPESILNCDYPRLYEKYRTAVARFSGVFPKSQRHCPTVLVAAFCRAWLALAGDPYMRDDLLGAAIKYGEMQFDTERMKPLRLLCQWIVEKNLRSQKDRREAYMRAANAIQAFLKRKTVKRLVPAQSDPFPLN
jgi:hypothetical protein